MLVMVALPGIQRDPRIVAGSRREGSVSVPATGIFRGPSVHVVAMNYVSRCRAPDTFRKPRYNFFAPERLTEMDWIHGARVTLTCFGMGSPWAIGRIS